MKNLYSLIVVLFAFVSGPSFSSAKQPIIIGLDADLSAVAKQGGLAIQRGALIAIEEINDKGGVLGRPLKLISKDHRGNPSRGLVNIENFATQENLVAVIGGVHTPVALNELPAIHKHKIIYLGPWAAGTPVVENGYQPNYVFRVSIRDNQAGKVLIGEAKRQGHKSVALLLERTGWGTSNEKSMKAAAEELGINISTIQWFNWREKDLSLQISNIINSPAEAIMLVANAPEGAVAALNLVNIDKEKRLPIISHWGISGGAFVSAVGLENLQQLDISVIQTFSFLTAYNKQKSNQVLAQYREQFEDNINAESIVAPVGVAHAYDLVYLLLQAIEQAGTIERTKVRDELERLPSYKGLVKEYTPAFSPQQHDALLAPDYRIMKYNEAGYLVPRPEGEN
ncbi:MAG: ABC transporter substrate-binding protein [Pseudomonadales bacterium]|nr:ABC transporter substrate-binding protein [Pseudomonadales bacterium]